jgi:multiple sugar transport system substrate-binding protein
MAMRTMPRALIGVAAALILGSAGAAGQETTPADDRQVDLTFMNWYYGPGDQESYDAIIADYQAQDPRVRDVIIEVVPFERYNDVLTVKMAGNNPPDIAWIDLSVGRAFVDSGRLYDLKPTLESIEGWDLADFVPASLTAWSDGDGLYALPFTNATNSVFYNAEAFREAGLPTPDEMVADGTWTWENVRQVAKQLVDSGAVRYGFTLANDIYINGWNQLIEVWEPYGGGPWSEDGKTCTFDAPETVEATQLIHDMIYEDKSYPEPGADVDFLTGDIGMALTRPDQYPTPPEFEWGVVSQPDGPLGYHPSVAQNGLAVFDGPNADIAAQLVAAMLSKENMLEYPVFPPGNRASLQTPELLLQSIPTMTEAQVEGTVVKAFQSPDQVLEYNHPNFGPIWTTAQRIFDGEMWREDADVAAVLGTVCDEIEDLLE